MTPSTTDLSPRSPAPAPRPADGRPHARQPQRGHLPPPVRRRLLHGRPQHHGDDVLPRRRRRGPEPTHGPRRRRGRGPRPRRHGRARRGRAAPGRTAARQATGAAAASGLRFNAIAPVPRTVDDVTVPARLRVGPDHPVGRPDLRGLAALRPDQPDRGATGAAVRLQQRLPRHHRDQPRRHPRPARVQPRVHQRGHHVPAGDGPGRAHPHGRGRRTACPWSSCERRSRGRRWTYVKGGRKNRRITLDTVFTVDGPAAGSALLKTAADTHRHARCAAR